MKKLKLSELDLNIETITKLENPEQIKGGAYTSILKDTDRTCGCTTHYSCDPDEWTF